MDFIIDTTTEEIGAITAYLLFRQVFFSFRLLALRLHPSEVLFGRRHCLNVKSERNELCVDFF